MTKSICAMCEDSERPIYAKGLCYPCWRWANRRVKRHRLVISCGGILHRLISGMAEAGRRDHA